MSNRFQFSMRRLFLVVTVFSVGALSFSESARSIVQENGSRFGFYILAFLLSVGAGFVVVAGRSPLHRESSPLASPARLHWPTWLLSLCVLYGAWGALADDFPFNEQGVWPTFYTYGWPICFATSSRARFDFHRAWVDVSAFVFDAVLVLLTFLATIIAAELIARMFRRHTIIDFIVIVLASLAGLTIVIALWRGDLDSVYEIAGNGLPSPSLAAVAGQARPISQVDGSIIGPMSVGLFCVGWLACAVLLWSAGAAICFVAHRLKR